MKKVSDNGTTQRICLFCFFDPKSPDVLWNPILRPMVDRSFSRWEPDMDRSDMTVRSNFSRDVLVSWYFIIVDIYSRWTSITFLCFCFLTDDFLFVYMMHYEYYRYSNIIWHLTSTHRTQDHSISSSDSCPWPHRFDTLRMWRQAEEEPVDTMEHTMGIS